MSHTTSPVTPKMQDYRTTAVHGGPTGAVPRWTMRAGAKIVFFDLETTTDAPTRRVLQFGSTRVDPTSFDTLPNGDFETMVGGPVVAPLITPLSQHINHIDYTTCLNAPSFADVADQIFEILNGAVWVGYNICKFDIPMLAKEFALCKKPVPVCVDAVDLYILVGFLSKTGRMPFQTPDLKLATLGRICGLGIEAHTALSDAIMCRDVFKVFNFGLPIPRSPPPPPVVTPPPVIVGTPPALQAWGNTARVADRLCEYLGRAEAGALIIVKLQRKTESGPQFHVVTLGRLSTDGTAFTATEHVALIPIGETTTIPVQQVEYAVRRFNIAEVEDIKAVIFK